MWDRSRRAFSLVELLIVFAIVLLLVGIALTGLQAARESARRLSCAANLRDLGLGLLHHHQALGVLPPFCGGPDSTSTQVWGSPPQPSPYPRPGIGLASGFVMLLPFIGEPTLSDAIAAAGWPFACSALYASARLPLLQCPSDPSPRSHNYLFSIGDRYRGFWPSSHIPAADDAPFQSQLRGLFGLQSRVRLESVRDGLSHTIAISECVRPRGLGRTVPSTETVGGVRYFGPAEAVVNDRFAVSFSDQQPASCLASFVNGGFRPGTTLFIMNYSPGWLWSFGRPSHISFSTVLPPNAPRCSDMETQGSLTPQSLHPGGVFGLMADGAVRFIADDIDAGDPSLPDRQTGPSPYGVWGALGSRAGAEVASLTLP
jgi:hypothetical protein